MNCSITTNLWTSHCFYCCCFSALIHGGQIGRRVLFQFSWTYWDLFCVPVLGQFQRKFYELLRRRFILLCLGKVFGKYLLEPFGLWPQLASAFMFRFHLTELSTWQDWYLYKENVQGATCDQYKQPLVALTLLVTRESAGRQTGVQIKVDSCLLSQSSESLIKNSKEACQLWVHAPQTRKSVDNFSLRLTEVIINDQQGYSYFLLSPTPPEQTKEGPKNVIANCETHGTIMSINVTEYSGTLLVLAGQINATRRQTNEGRLVSITDTENAIVIPKVKYGIGRSYVSS